MSHRYRMLIILILCSALVLFSCGGERFSFSDCFERSFSANVRVVNGTDEYLAQIAVDAVIDTVTGEEAADRGRDAYIRYLSPDSISDITVQRTGGEVTVGVSGIEIKPSPAIAQRYTAIVDMLDIRAFCFKGAERKETDGTDVYEAVYSYEGKDAVVLYECTSKLPVSLRTSDIMIYFTEFVYT